MPKKIAPNESPVAELRQLVRDLVAGRRDRARGRRFSRRSGRLTFSPREVFGRPSVPGSNEWFDPAECGVVLRLLVRRWG